MLSARLTEMKKAVVAQLGQRALTLEDIKVLAFTIGSDTDTLEQGSDYVTIKSKDGLERLTFFRINNDTRFYLPKFDLYPLVDITKTIKVGGGFSVRLGVLRGWRIYLSPDPNQHLAVNFIFGKNEILYDRPLRIAEFTSVCGVCDDRIWFLMTDDEFSTIFYQIKDAWCELIDQTK